MLTSPNLSLAITAQDAADLSRSLFTEDGCENFAVLFCGSARGSEHRLLVREWWAAPYDAYRERLSYHLDISPTFINRVVDHAVQTHLSPVLVHSHPGASPAVYSLSDDHGERKLLPVLSQLLPGLTPASLLMTPKEVRGRHLVNGKFITMHRINVIGASTVTNSHPYQGSTQLDGGELDEFDRQVRAVGVIGQQALRSLQVAIIGCGGTGSAVAEQVARLGIRDFILVDPDQVERTNLSRLWGALSADIGRAKVEVIGDHLTRISP